MTALPRPGSGPGRGPFFVPPIDYLVRVSLVPGGAGFLGSHLCDYLLERGEQVICLDNLETGRAEDGMILEIP